MSAAEGFEEFVAIVDGGSITAAAEELGLPRPTLSRRLARLEERLGVRLVHRTTRRLSVTPAGERLYATARAVILAARDAEAEVRRLDDVPRGLLRVSIPPAVPEPLFSTLVTDYLSMYPEVSIEVVATSEYVDLVADGFDVAIRGGFSADSSLIARTLANSRQLAVASPGYLARRGTPSCSSDLAEHECLVGFRDGKLPEQSWPLLSGGSVRVSGRYRTNKLQSRLEAALNGHGIALVIETMVDVHIAEGRLVHVLPGIVGEAARIAVLYADRAFVDPKVRTFVDHVATRLKRARREFLDGRSRAAEPAPEPALDGPMGGG